MATAGAWTHLDPSASFARGKKPARELSWLITLPRQSIGMEPSSVLLAFWSIIAFASTEVGVQSPGCQDFCAKIPNRVQNTAKFATQWVQVGQFTKTLSRPIPFTMIQFHGEKPQRGIIVYTIAPR